jgi:peptide/nickel transport system substrate-binding protein
VTARDLVGTVLMASLAAGCSSPSNGPPPSSTPTAAPAASREQPLLTATISDPKTFNPILATDEPSNVAVGQLFDALVRLDPRTTEIEPSLATRWECDADGTECTFHLRHDVLWHDGKPFTAADVVFTFDAIYDDRVPNSLKHVLTVDGRRLEVEAVDDYTVSVRPSRPFAPLLNSIGVPIIPKHVLGDALAAGQFARKWGIDTPPDQLIGTGAYRMVRYVPSQYVELRRNPHYWMKDENGAPLPYIETRIIRILPDQDTAYLKFLSGQTSIHNPRPEEVPDLHDREKELGIVVQEIGLDTGSLFVTFNRNPAHYVRDGKRDPRLDWFTDKHFLQALAHAIDKQSLIVNCLNGFGRPSTSYISPENTVFYDPHLKDYEYDLDSAREILTEAGYRDRDGDGVIEDRNGNPVEFSLNTNAGNQVREKMCSILQQDWNALGMKVNYRPLDFTLLVEKLDTTFDWDAVLMGFTGAIEPHNAANLLRSSGNLHLWNPNEPSPATDWEAEIDRLLREGSAELDPDKRRQIYWRIQEILHEQLPMIDTVLETRFTAYTNKLENFYPTVWGVYRPESIEFAP